MTKKIEILVVEDRPENIAAAKEFFNKQKDVEVYYAKNAKEARKALENKNFDLALIDWRLPEGKVGFEILEEAKKRAIPAAVFTEGKYYHGTVHGKRSDLFLDEHAVKDSSPVSYKFGPKNDPKSWEEAYKKLLEISNVEEIKKAKERYKRFTGKKF
ncbi:MAG: response regulator [Candidatus Pacearchaeota archaeon]